MLSLLSLVAVSGPWAIKPIFDTKQPQVWAVVVVAHDNGQDHTAKFNFKQSLLTAPDKTPGKVSIARTDLMLEDNPTDVPGPWEGHIDASGAYLDVADADYWQMLAPLNFVYPAKPVSPGDVWETTLSTKGAEPFKLKFTADGVEKLDGKDVLKIISRAKQTGGHHTAGEGLWWIAQDGKILKYEINLSRWSVPMAGNEGMECRFTATLKTK